MIINIEIKSLINVKISNLVIMTSVTNINNAKPAPIFAGKQYFSNICILYTPKIFRGRPAAGVSENPSQNNLYDWSRGVSYRVMFVQTICLY